MREDTWLVVHRTGKPNMIVGPFESVRAAVEFEFADGFDYDMISFAGSCDEANAERGRVWQFISPTP